MPVPAKFNSLKALYFVTRQYFSGSTDQPTDDMPKFGLSEYSVRIGSKVIPSTKPNSVPQFLAEMERALGSQLETEFLLTTTPTLKSLLMVVLPQVLMLFHLLSQLVLKPKVIRRRQWVLSIKVSTHPPTISFFNQLMCIMRPLMSA
jgi:hypothetical protein